MKLTLIAAALAALTAAPAVAQSITSPSGVVLADDLARPDTWRFHERERSCDPNMWQEPVGHNVWMNVTCETLTNSSKESRRERRAARDAAEQAREDAANQPPMPEAPVEPAPPADDTPPSVDPTPPVDEPAPDADGDAPPAGNGNASANNGKGGNYDRTGHTDNGKGKGRGRG